MLETCTLTCPYCWAGFETTVDCSAGSQEYIEDCPVCCGPIQFRAQVGDDGGLLDVETFRDDE